MRNITSLDNQEIKNIAALKDAKERYAQEKFVAEGVRTISTILKGNIKLSALYVIEKLFTQALEIAAADKIIIISERVMDKISQTTSPSGILAVFEMPKNPSPELLTPGLVLANISDPGNMGTLMRTAAALDIKSVVVVDGTDPFGPKVVQASAGTIAQLNVFTWQWHELIHNKGTLTLHALVVSNGKKPETVDKKSALLVIGNEAHGIDKNWIADCTDQVTIPMPGNTESLNAAIAGSITAYEVFGK